MNVIPWIDRDLRVELANEIASEVRGYIRTTWPDSQSYNGVYPRVTEDAVGVRFTKRYEYLKYQNGGFETFVMSELKGKVIPMMIDGELVFRYANPRRIGKFDGRRAWYVRRESDGTLYRHEEPRRRWTHPGLMPRNFVEQAIRRVFRWRRPAILDNARHNIRRFRAVWRED